MSAVYDCVLYKDIEYNTMAYLLPNLVRLEGD